MPTNALSLVAVLMAFSPQQSTSAWVREVVTDKMTDRNVYTLTAQGEGGKLRLSCYPGKAGGGEGRFIIMIPGLLDQGAILQMRFGKTEAVMAKLSRITFPMLIKAMAASSTEPSFVIESIDATEIGRAIGSKSEIGADDQHRATAEIAKRLLSVDSLLFETTVATKSAEGEIRVSGLRRFEKEIEERCGMPALGSPDAR